MTPESGADATRLTAEQVTNKTIRMVCLNAIGLKVFSGKIPEIKGEDKVSLTYDGSGQYVPIIRVG